MLNNMYRLSVCPSLRKVRWSDLQSIKARAHMLILRRTRPTEKAPKMPIGYNQYFDSKVQSLGSERNGKKFSVGIISAGHYHFGTGAAERMTVVSGMLTAKLDGTEEWIHYPAGTNFEIPANSGFDVKASVDTAYQCEYL